MSRRATFWIYLAGSILCALLLIQGIAYGAAGNRISIPGAIFTAAIQVTLVTLCIRARPRRESAPE